ncbi:MAG: sugar phosphate isomerase/epimerase, partial [Sedimentisphaerales bacterium]|nr:sugar phosphate isomerase/epimerase [Sedimentisphaerales bacterium]
MTPLDKLSRRAFLERSARVAATGLAGSYVTSLSASASGQSTDGLWQIGCYTRPWDKYDYRAAQDAIAEAGFKYAGLMTTSSKTHLVISVDTTLEEAQQVREEVKKRGLQVLSVYGGDIAAAKSLKAGIEDLRKLIDNCAACGAKNLLMGGTGDKQVYQAYYKAITECCDYAAEKGIGISIKPHGGLNATGPQCRKAVEIVAHKNFRIWYDPGNILYYSDGQLDPVADAAAVDGLVTGMCVKDYRHPKNVAVTPGTGQVNFPAVLARLKKGGFTGGPLIVECLEPADAEKTLGEAKKARLFLENLTGQKPQTAAQTVRPSETLRAGVAVIDITPPIGYRMSGYFYERLSTAVMNPLHAKAIVLRQQDQSAALVFCDLIGLSREVTSRARKQASEKTGIPPENILIAATHSHTGPLYSGALRKHFHDVAVAKYGSDPCEEVDYAGVLAEKIAQVIAQADAATKPVRLQAGVARQQGLSFNRRFH